MTLVAGFVVAFLASGCGAPPVSHYQGLQDGLAIPVDWQRVTETIAGPGTSTSCTPLLAGCPRVTRYYLTPDTPSVAFTQAKASLLAAGFATSQVSASCEPPPSSPACYVFGTRDGDGIYITAYNPGDHPDSAVAPGDRTIVRISASPKGGSGDVRGGTS